MKKFEEPMLEINEFQVEDVITTSGDLVPENPTNDMGEWN